MSHSNICFLKYAVQVSAIEEFQPGACANTTICRQWAGFLVINKTEAGDQWWEFLALAAFTVGFRTIAVMALRSRLRSAKLGGQLY